MFLDGNKRVANLAANKEMIKNGQGIISIPVDKIGEYFTKLINYYETNNIRLCPVFDNGASFYNKTNTVKFKEYLEDPSKFKQVVYDSEVSVFDENGKNINPLKYIGKKIITVMKHYLEYFLK